MSPSMKVLSDGGHLLTMQRSVFQHLPTLHIWLGISILHPALSLLLLTCHLVSPLALAKAPPTILILEIRSFHIQSLQ